MGQGSADKIRKARSEVEIAERGGYDPIRADGPLRQAIRLLRHQDAGRSPAEPAGMRTANGILDPLMRSCSNRLIVLA